eukprot:c5512_g1_i1 orf=219-437(+)
MKGMEKSRDMMMMMMRLRTSKKGAVEEKSRIQQIMMWCLLSLHRTSEPREATTTQHKWPPLCQHAFTAYAFP